MNHLTADEDLLDRLRGIVEPVEIRDPEGKLLGVYTPHVTAEVRALYERAKSLFNPAEVKRRAEAEKGQGAPLSEVWERLRAVEKKGCDTP